MLAQWSKDAIYDAKAAVKPIFLHPISDSTEFCRYSDILKFVINVIGCEIHYNSTTIYYLNFQADILKLLLSHQHSIKQNIFHFQLENKAASPHI